MASTYDRPPLVFGLLLVGSILVLLEGLIELGLSVWAISFSNAAVFFLVPGLAIALGIVLLFFSLVYALAPSGVVGVLCLVLGGLSFLLGGGFVVGGVLIVVGGTLAAFGEWITEELVPRWSGPGVPESSKIDSPIPTSLPPAGGTPAAGTSSVSAKIVVYRLCPSCGELNPRDSSRCASCGKTFE